MINSAPTARIILNMIVLNESRIICRLLESCLPFISGYVIMDTGSTDNTPQLIRDFFEAHPVPCGGEVILGGTHIDPNYKFNFAKARNESLAHCMRIMGSANGGANADYILLVDADMQLVISEPLWTLPLPPTNAYRLVQSTGGINHSGFFNPNVRIIPITANNTDTQYFGYTHEYISHNYPVTQIPRDIMYIADIGDGCSKSNKHLRDISLCLDGIDGDVPHMRGRYTFYLAESYRYHATTLGTDADAHTIYQKAIDAYVARIALGEWEQEVWCCYYAIGKCYMGMKQPEKAVYWWLLGYEYYPHRIENLYHVVKHYRDTSNHRLAFFYYTKALQIITDDPLCNTETARESMLFLENDIYTYLLLFEYTIIASYLGVKAFNKEVVQLFNTASDALVAHGVLFNMQFYHNCLDNGDNTRVFYKTMTCPFAPPFINSSASIIPFAVPTNPKVKYLMNMRGVNYRINHKTGAYTMLNPDDSGATETNLIITQNMRIYLDAAFNIVYDNNESNALVNIAIAPGNMNTASYRGVEDVRIFTAPTIADKTPIFFMGTHCYNGKLGIAFGEYNATTTDICNLVAPFAANRACEKNWVFVNYCDEPCIIYEWCDAVGNLVICNIEIAGDAGEQLMEIVPIATRPMPPIFRYARGSTNATLFIDADGNKENWFIVHLVDTISAPRHYYHMVVIMDADMNLKRYSAPFTFDNNAIEYCLSLLVDTETVTMCYSTWDSSTAIATYKKTYIDGLCN